MLLLIASVLRAVLPSCHFNLKYKKSNEVWNLAAKIKRASFLMLLRVYGNNNIQYLYKTIHLGLICLFTYELKTLPRYGLQYGYLTFFSLKLWNYLTVFDHQMIFSYQTDLSVFRLDINICINKNYPCNISLKIIISLCI